MTRRSIKNSDEAEALALEVVQFVLADEDIQNRFLALSGISPKEVKNSIHDNNFLGGVLDFLLSNETDVLRFCEEFQVDPEQPLIARRLLPGNTPEH